MPSLLPPSEPFTLDGLSPDKAERLLARARALQLTADLAGSLLRGKNIGLLCEHASADDPQGDIALFRRAAAGLGAHVACIRPQLSASSPAPLIRGTAVLLGRFYDAVACHRLPHALVMALRRHAPLPVFDGIATADHPLALLAHRLDGPGTWDERRGWLLQALLVEGLK
jgi:ornithine carbamoyltransferase